MCMCTNVIIMYTYNVLYVPDIKYMLYMYNFNRMSGLVPSSSCYERYNKLIHNGEINTGVIKFGDPHHVFGDPRQNRTSCLCMRAHVLAWLYPYLYIVLKPQAIGSLRMAPLHYCQRRSIKVGYSEAIDCLELDWRWILI